MWGCAAFKPGHGAQGRMGGCWPTCMPHTQAGTPQQRTCRAAISCSSALMAGPVPTPTVISSCGMGACGVHGWVARHPCIPQLGRDQCSCLRGAVHAWNSGGHPTRPSCTVTHPQEGVRCQGCRRANGLLLCILLGAGGRGAATACLLAASRGWPHCRQAPLEAAHWSAAEAQGPWQGRWRPGQAAGRRRNAERRDPAQGHPSADAYATGRCPRHCIVRQTGLAEGDVASRGTHVFPCGSSPNPGACTLARRMLH